MYVLYRHMSSCRKTNRSVTRAYPVKKHPLSKKLALDLEYEIRYRPHENADMLDFVARQPQFC